MKKGFISITVPFAELSAYVDPAAEQIELIAYTQDSGTMTTSSVPLTIGPMATAVPMATATVAPTATPEPTIEPTLEPEIVEVEPTTAPPTILEDDDGGSVQGLMDQLGPNALYIIGAALLVMMGMVVRRRK